MSEEESLEENRLRGCGQAESEALVWARTVRAHTSASDSAFG